MGEHHSAGEQPKAVGKARAATASVPPVVPRRAVPAVPAAKPGPTAPSSPTASSRPATSPGHAAAGQVEPPGTALLDAAARTQARVTKALDELRAAIDSHDAAVAAAVRAGLTRQDLRESGVLEDPAGQARRAVDRVARAEPVVGVARAEPVRTPPASRSAGEDLAKTKVGMPALDDPGAVAPD